jgi:hypothetical protein
MGSAHRASGISDAFATQTANATSVVALDVFVNCLPLQARMQLRCMYVQYCIRDRGFPDPVAVVDRGRLSAHQ